MSDDDGIMPLTMFVRALGGVLGLVGVAWGLWILVNRDSDFMSPIFLALFSVWAGTMTILAARVAEHIEIIARDRESKR